MYITIWTVGAQQYSGISRFNVRKWCQADELASVYIFTVREKDKNKSIKNPTSARRTPKVPCMAPQTPAQRKGLRGRGSGQPRRLVYRVMRYAARLLRYDAGVRIRCLPEDNSAIYNNHQRTLTALSYVLRFVSSLKQNLHLTVISLFVTFIIIFIGYKYILLSLFILAMTICYIKTCPTIKIKLFSSFKKLSQQHIFVSLPVDTMKFYSRILLLNRWHSCIHWRLGYVDICFLIFLYLILNQQNVRKTNLSLLQTFTHPRKRP